MSLALDLLKDRAQMLQQAREFFRVRSVMEVDVSALRPRAPIASHIDVISASVSDTEVGFLHTSPEYAMKQLLSQGSGDIYFLGHVFRKNELGRLHNPEFTMVEWYRTKIPFAAMIEETCAFLDLFFGPLPRRQISYKEAFQTYVGLDPETASLESLRSAVKKGGETWDRTPLTHYLLTHQIEPHLGKDELTILIDYPPHEAALACVIEKEGALYAERFEIYYKGVELTNGYHELADASELRRRFLEENQLRKASQKETYLLDEEFLESLQKGFPPCCGVAVGFDRAFMLRHQKSSLRETLPFSWVSIN